ncbi:MAG: response regulator [Betaproteobacteria bacterium]|nr:MAG: response regulator [Betaproteobacteria bacterium]
MSDAGTPKTLRLLHVEDSEDDALLINEEFIAAGYQLSATRVDTAEGLRHALQNGPWDLVITDISMPDFDAVNALAIVNETNPDIPCIVVSGAIGEEAAVALMKAGASDFIIKQSLSRLAPAAERSLREVAARRERSEAIAALRESETRFKSLATNIPGMVFQSRLKADGSAEILYASEGAMAVYGVLPSVLIEQPGTMADMVHPDDRESFLQARIESHRSGTARNWEGRIRVGEDKEIKWVNLRATARRLNDGVVMSEGIVNNITESKLAEERLRRSREQLRQLSAHVDTVREDERAHIAREIHDDLGGTLTAAKIDLEWLRKRLPGDATDMLGKVNNADALLDHAIDSARSLSRRLRPVVLDHGLIAAVEWQAKEFAARTGIDLDVACPNDEIELAPKVSTALFRVFQETLTNVARHAQASMVSVELVSDGDVVTLIIQDNGCGMDLSAAAKEGSFGLRGMRERVDTLHGQFILDSGPGNGTRIEVNIPLPGSKVDETQPLEAGFQDNSDPVRKVS